jgi:hypothetical protein
MGLPDGGLKEEDLLGCYGLSREELEELREDGEFRELLQAEEERAGSFGRRAAFYFKAELMAQDLAERLYERVPREGRLSEMMELYKLLARSAGMDAPPERPRGPGSVGSAVQINIQVPDLPKLAHARVRDD